MNMRKNRRKRLSKTQSTTPKNTVKPKSKRSWFYRLSPITKFFAGVFILLGGIWTVIQMYDRCNPPKEKPNQFDKEKFELENEPAVIATNFLLNLKDSLDPTITYAIYNLGKHQVQAISYKFSALITDIPFSQNLYDSVSQIIKEYPYNSPLTSRGEIRIFHLNDSSFRKYYKQVLKKEVSVFGFGSVKYKNSISKEIEVYKFAVKIIGINRIEFNSLPIK